MTGNNYKVAWKSKAALKFSKLFNVDHRRVLRYSRYLLSANPYEYADGVADFPGCLEYVHRRHLPPGRLADRPMNTRVKCSNED
jgi:hypothetical protein